MDVWIVSDFAYRRQCCCEQEVGLCTFLSGTLFHLSRYLGADLLFSISLGHLLRNCQTDFQRGCHHFTFPPINDEAPVSPQKGHLLDIKERTVALSSLAQWVE